MRKRILALLLLATGTAVMSSCAVLNGLSSEKTVLSAAETSAPASQAVAVDAQSSAQPETVGSAALQTQQQDSGPSPQAFVSAAPAPVPTSNIPLEYIAQAVSFAVEPSSPYAMSGMLSELYTWAADRHYDFPAKAPQGTAANVEDVPHPLIQAVLDTAVWTDSQYHLSFDAAAADRLFQALYGGRSAVFSDESAIRADGRYYLLPREYDTSCVYYADANPYPHASDNTYRFREYCPTSDVGSWLTEVTIVPDEASPLGFHIEQVRNPEDGIDYGYHSDGFVFPDSDTRYISEADIQKLESQNYREWDLLEIFGFARNEIFARHGNTFDTPKYAEFFSQFDWYEPTHKVDMTELNAVEQANVRTIQQWEADPRFQYGS